MISKTSKLIALILVIIITGCKDSSQYTPIKKTSIEENHYKTHKVEVKEVKEAGIYTYVKVLENEKEYWIATSSTKLEIGQTCYFDGGTKMVNFKSEELDKTFEEIIFVDAVRSHEKKSPEMDSSIPVIEQPEDGTPINEILANSESFKEKEITVKGKVVKINRNILDRNWIHLRDGTNFKDKSNLTFTTNDTIIKLGDIVTLKGVITLNKDFGYGYVYPILVEEAVVIKN
jgi:hypothetical protein